MRYYGGDFANRTTPKVVEARSLNEARQMMLKTAKRNYGSLRKVYPLNANETHIAERGGWVPGRAYMKRRDGIGPRKGKKRRRK